MSGSATMLKQSDAYTITRALHAHITHAAQLQSALTDIERNRICRESDPMEDAMHMLLVAFATDHFNALMVRHGVGRP